MHVRRPLHVLFDRDGTLVVDVPYNGSASKVVAIDGARRDLDRLRSAGLSASVVTNQSGIGRGLLQLSEVEEVNHRVEELLGPFSSFELCPHVPTDFCNCRKPEPRLLLDAAAAAGVAIADCIMVGDKLSDMQAAQAVNIPGILVSSHRSLHSFPSGALSFSDAVTSILAM